MVKTRQLFPGVSFAKTVSILSLLALLSHPAAAQNNGDAVPTTISGSDIHISVVYVDEPVKIDGKLDDSAWLKAKPYEEYFFQQEPHDRVPSSEKTKVMVIQNRDTIYFGIQSYDSEPEKIFSSAMRRDKDIFRDDVIELLIDTFRDFRNCYAFATNPLGVKGDAIISDEGADINKSWDCIWQVKSSVNENGWATEIALPFKSLKYRKGEVVEWGLNITRIIKHRNETTYLAPIPRGLGHDGKFKGEIYAVLENIVIPDYAINLEVQPYVRTGGTWLRHPEKKSDSEFDGGIDARYQITPELTLDATYNTDFAQIESEEEVVNVTRFNVYLPEKRDFFLENAGIFNFSMTSSAGEYYDKDADFILFNSRTIGIAENKRTPLYGGAKLAGRAGKFTLGVMNIQSEETTLDDRSTVPSTNFTALRLKRDILTNSYIGLMALNKQTASDEFSRTLGVDSFLAYSHELYMKGSLARTFEQDDKGHDLAGDVKVTLNKAWIDASIGYTSIDSLFTPEMGYVRRSNMRETDGSLAFTKWINNRYLRSIEWENEVVYTTNQENVLETRENSSEISVSATSGDSFRYGIHQDYDYLPAADSIRDITIDAGRYTAWYHTVSLSSYSSRPVKGSISYRWGEYLDGKNRSLTLSNGTKFTNHFIMDLNYTHNRIELAKGDLTANVLAGRWTYSFTTDFFAKCYVQWNDADKRISQNFLIDYIYKPKSHIYFVYNENRDTSLGRNDNVKDRIVMVKVTYLFNM